MTLQTFRDRVKNLPEKYSVLELGTKRWGKAPTYHKDWISGWGSWICSDIEDGQDVELVCDAHALSSHKDIEGKEGFDVLWASSVFEHLKKPWIASMEIEKILKRGGLFFVQTHFTFPLHGYPNDYFRFTEDGLRSIFDWGTDLKTAFEYPCSVTSKEVDTFTGFLNVSITGRKN